MPVISPLDSFHLVSSPPQSKLCLSVWHVVIVPFPYQIISPFFFFFSCRGCSCCLDTHYFGPNCSSCCLEDSQKSKCWLHGLYYGWKMLLTAFHIIILFAILIKLPQSLDSFFVKYLVYRHYRVTAQRWCNQMRTRLFELSVTRTSLLSTLGHFDIIICFFWRNDIRWI